jgi:hypothetical protein
MSVAELKGSLHQMIETIEDASVLTQLLSYLQLIQKNSAEDWSMTEADLTEMAMSLSALSLSEVWDHEEDEHWNTYEN